MTPASLPKAWREKATEFRRFGAEDQAFTLEYCANDLDEAWRDWQQEPLTLEEAGEKSGYSADHLGRLVREGKIPNAGRSGAPRIARRDLPVKSHQTARGVVEDPEQSDSSFEQIVQSIIEEGVG